MQLSNWVIIGALEAYALLIVVCIFLLYHTHGLKGLIRRLQEKIQALVSDLAKTRQEFKDIQQQGAAGSYCEQLEEQIDHNRDHHQSLEPDRDIALDLDENSPLDRKIISLRHAMLIAEKEAALASDTDIPNWDIIKAKFGGFLEFFGRTESPTKASSRVALEDDSDAVDGLQEALNESYQRIENLEKFQQLFFDMEDQWEEARQQADDYFQQLQNLNVGEDSRPAYDQLLQQYKAVYDGLEGQFKQANKPAGTIERVTEEQTTPRNSAELEKLRNVTANQHHLINELQRRLDSANTDEKRVQLMEDLKKQLEQQVRFVKESETCIELMDNELQHANERIEALEREINNKDARVTRINDLESNIEKSAIERLKMKRMIDNLEQENDQLAQQAMSSVNSGNTSDTQALKTKLKQLQQQYLGLEEKYLKLRTKS